MNILEHAKVRNMHIIFCYISENVLLHPDSLSMKVFLMELFVEDAVDLTPRELRNGVLNCLVLIQIWQDNFNLHNAWKSLSSSILLLLYGVNSLLEIDYKEINALIGGSKIKKNIKKVIFFPKRLVQPKIVEQPRYFFLSVLWPSVKTLSGKQKKTVIKSHCQQKTPAFPIHSIFPFLAW